MIIYLDESGQSKGFKQGSSNTFNIALLVTENKDAVKKVIRSFEKKQIKKGWPIGVEIKASKIWDARRNPEIPDSYKFKNTPSIPLKEIFGKLICCPIEIDYISVKKEYLDENLKSAPFGIVYNYLTWEILKYRTNLSSSIELIVDALNKEVHTGKYFDGYIQTQAFEQNPKLNQLLIRHLDSSEVMGLRAVDYFSWGIHRKYEFNDSSFYDLFSGKFNSNNMAWFYNK